VQGDENVVELLNEVLTAELAVINQYFLDAKMLDNWGIRAARRALPLRVDRRNEGRR
jgi:bacterioferritin (cytochrome b1)